MLTHPKILAWGAYNFEKMPKTGSQNIADVYLKSRKKQTNGDIDLKYGLKLTFQNLVAAVAPLPGGFQPYTWRIY